jgi:hypothetical protein
LDVTLNSLEERFLQLRNSTDNLNLCMTDWLLTWRPHRTLYEHAVITDKVANKTYNDGL